MKDSIKKRLKKLEETLKEKSAPLDPVIIYDPEAPLPGLCPFTDRILTFDRSQSSLQMPRFDP